MLVSTTRNRRRGLTRKLRHIMLGPLRQTVAWSSAPIRLVAADFSAELRGAAVGASNLGVDWKVLQRPSQWTHRSGCLMQVPSLVDRALDVFDRVAPPSVAHAHCDIPCGIYGAH